MKPNFALKLSLGGIVLLQRSSPGWAIVGEADPSAPDLDARMAELKAAAERLSPGATGVKVVIPNDQIRFISTPAGPADPGARRRALRAALDGATPYPIEELSCDSTVSGDTLYIAAVALETLEEADSFARTYGFHPMSFVATPEQGDYAGEPFFGAANDLPPGETVEKDLIPIRISGRVRAPEAKPVAQPVPQPAPKPEPPVAFASVRRPRGAGPTEGDAPAAAPSAPAADAVADAATEPAKTPEQTAKAPAFKVPLPPSPKPQAAPDVTLKAPVHSPAAPDRREAPAATPAPMFDNAKDGDADLGFMSQMDDLPPMPAAAKARRGLRLPSGAFAVAALQTARRKAGGLKRRIDAITGRGPALRRDPEEVRREQLAAALKAAPTFAPQPKAEKPADRPSPFPSIPSLPRDPMKEAALKAASAPKVPSTAELLKPAPRPTPKTPTPALIPGDTAAKDKPADPPAGDKPAKGAPKVLLDQPAAEAPAAHAVPAVAEGPAEPVAKSRRGRKAKAREKTPVLPSVSLPSPRAVPVAGPLTPEQRKEEAERMTVFGARKGGGTARSPRYLGLVLTILLLIFMAGVAAWAAVFLDDNMSALLQPREDVAAVAEEGEPAAEDGVVLPAALPSPSAEAGAETAPEPEATGSAEPQTDTAPEAAPAATAEAETPADAPAAPETGAEAEARYAATGIWQQSPSPLDTPGAAASDQARIPDAQASMGARGEPGFSLAALAPDSRPATPMPPLGPGLRFDLDERGLVTATPEGTLSPSGPRIYTGAPPILPPVRPGEEAPAAPDQQAAALPDAQAPPGTAGADTPEADPGTPDTAPPTADATGTTPDPAPATDTETAEADTGTDTETDTGATAPDTADTALTVEAPQGDPATPDQTAEADPEPQVDRPTPSFTALRPRMRPGSGTLPAESDGATEPAAEPAQDAALPADTTGDAATDTATADAADTADAAAESAAEDVELAAAASLAEGLVRPRPRPSALVPDADRAAVAAGLAAAGIAGTSTETDPEAEADAEAEADRPTAGFVALRPLNRPANIGALAEAARATPVPPPSVSPAIPSAASVTRQATIRDAIDLATINLIGVYGQPASRRALVRLSNGRYQKVKVGDRIDGGRIIAIGEDSLRYQKGGRNVTLDMPSG